MIRVMARPGYAKRALAAPSAAFGKAHTLCRRGETRAPAASRGAGIAQVCEGTTGRVIAMSTSGWVTRH
jgi:hypothetical protein